MTNTGPSMPTEDDGSSPPADAEAATSPTRPSAPPVVLSWWRELMIAGTFYLLYSLVRNTFGAGAESRSIAFRHARGVIKVEQFFGLWIEPELQRWYLSLPFNGFIRGWNIFYGTAHFAVTIGVLVFAFRRAPARYLFARTMLAATTALALIGFAFYTLMPPRLLDANGLHGACAGLNQGCNDYGMIDTIERWGGIWKFGEGGMAVVSNQYAAMPSLHFGWSTWCAITVILVIGHGRARWFALLYPTATLFCILVTANHFWLDAFFGGLALAAGWLVAVLVQRFNQWRYQRANSAEPGHRGAVVGAGGQ
ncbi:MAG: phosphatase PAP2 family protein [Aquihabitans sp.]